MTAILFLLRCAFVALLLICQHQLADGQVADNLGTEFIIVFMRNDVEKPLNFPLEIFITTPSTIPVQVQITAPKYTAQHVSMSTTVVSGVVERIEVSDLLRMHWTTIEGKVILIQADSEVVVYGLNKEKFSTDGFLAYPTDVIGYEYYTVSHYPTNSNTEFAIAAKYDDTKISIRLPLKTRLKPDLRVEHLGVRYTNGDWLNVTLQSFEAFQCVSYDKADLTATYIVADKPVAVFSGNIRTWVGESNSRDHLAIQLPPVEAYGRQFPIIPIPGRTVGDMIKVIAPIPNTNIRAENADSGVENFETTSPDFYKSFLIPSGNYTTISADQPVLVVQVSQSQQESSEPGDPTMLVVTSTPQFAADYVFSTPQYSIGGSYDNYLMVVIRASDVDGLMFDGKRFSRLNPIWKSFPSTDLVGTEVQITEGAHVINHISPVATFSGYVYGTADKESYSFQIGARLAPINQPCITTQSVFGDGIDNDCDGLIDEELCTSDNKGTDTDRDELIDEDCALTRPIAEGAPDSGGKQFLVYFMENNVESPRYLPLEIYVTPVRASSVTVRVESPRWFEPYIREDATIALGSVRQFNIPYTLREQGTTMTSKSLFITADADVVVYGVNKEIYSADAFLAVPLDVLGKTYYAVTHWPNSDASKCQLGVIGVHDGTRLDITFPPHTGRGTIDVEYDGITYTNGHTLTVAINRYSTLQLQSRGDLSGTQVKSTQKVAVLSGNIRTSVGQGSSRDHLAAMLPPVESWGRQYCTVPIPGRSTGDYFYVMASEDNSTIEISNRASITLHAGQSQMFTVGSDEYASFRSDKPILLTQLSQSQRTTNEIGDPTMIVLPSVEQWGNAYTFSTTTNSYSGAGNEFYNNYVVMVAPSNRTDGIIFDGQYLPPLFTGWYSIQDTAYSGTSFAISEGVHTIQHEDPTVTVSVLVYGNADKESYGFPAGMRLANINAPCDTTYPVPGDGIDNDCDGKIDEEICEGEQLQTDEDNDGRFNEDCAIIITPPEPQTTLLPPTTTSATTTQPPIPVTVVGPPGPPGDPGMQGMPGAQGAPGLNGIPGQPGTNGLPGLDGDDGETGSTGATGSKGQTGNTGMQGATGMTGASGAMGPSGVVGATGASGVKGEQGSSVKGEKGANGVAGALGPEGPTGATGDVGANGTRGSVGATGATGATGVQGQPGVKGEVGPGYEDVNECTEGTHQCSDVCINTIGSFYCSCPQGHELDSSGRQCQDEDECSKNNGGCTDKCINSVGGFNCSCTESGYHLSKDMKTCVDLDECAAGRHECGEKQICVNSVGSFVCMNITEPPPPVSSTTPQMELSGCAVNNGGCTDTCYDTEDSFYCSCQKTGYMLANNAQTCIDIDECDIGNNDCEAVEQMCVNSLGSYYCINTTIANSGSSVAPTAAASSATEGLINGDLILAMLLWLILISVLLLPMLILVLVQHYRHREIKEDYTSNLNDLYKLIDEHSPSQSPKLHRNTYDASSTASSTAPSISYA